MLRAPIIHPQILSALASAGHKSLIIIADAHFAAATSVSRNAVVVHAALSPGAPLVPDVAALVSRTIAIEAMTSMQPTEPGLEAVSDETFAVLPRGSERRAVSREEFVALTRSADAALCIVTGDTRRFANAILRVGVTRD